MPVYTQKMRFVFALTLLSGCAAPSATRSPAAIPAATLKISSERSINPFAKIKAPKVGPARAVGGYSGGCLFGAVKMPKSGKGFETVRRSRKRDYAHPLLAEVLVRAGQALGQNSTMLYGDLAQARGGPMPGGHVSHQSGLDADIWFHKYPATKKLSEHEREHLYGSSVLRRDFLDIDPRKWHEVYTAQLMWFAGQDETERIFVNAAIKRRLCKQFPGDSRLAKLRPWYFHDDHFHLRLKCPANDTSCVSQDPIQGIECDEKI